MHDRCICARRVDNVFAALDATIGAARWLARAGVAAAMGTPIVADGTACPADPGSGRVHTF